jgi:hypothetical protein
MNDLIETFGEPIYVYTRADALADGVLVDVTEWASAEEGFIGGFRVPVAVTASVWQDLNDIPTWAEGCQDLRGRAHDLLFMASLAARRGSGNAMTFQVILSTSHDACPQEDGEGAGVRSYRLVCGPDDDASPCITIMREDED